MEKSDEIWRIKHVRKFDKQNFNELIVAFARHSSNSSDFSITKVLRYTVCSVSESTSLI